jgi:hypothetical protein
LLDALTAATMPHRYELPFQRTCRGKYVAFLDPAGGSGSDSMTMAVAHRDDTRDRIVLDLVREEPPPFSPAQTVAAFAATLAQFEIRTVTSDRFAGSWPMEAFAGHHITVTPSPRTKSEIYQSHLPQIMSGVVELLDLPKLQTQYATLERKTARGGRDSIDHAPRAHDDLCNASAGACVLAGDRPPLSWITW